MNSGEGTTRQEAIEALLSRGIHLELAEELQQYGTPDQILAVCHRWDREHNVGAGALVYRMRQREFPAPEPPAGAKAKMLRARFDDYAARYPIDTIAEPHDRLIRRRWPDDPYCSGNLIVIETSYPNITVECDRCGFAAAYPVRSLHVLGQPTLTNAEPPPAEEVF